MRAVMPYIELEGDDDGRIMARSGQFRGMDKTKAVWIFGFIKNSPFAEAFGVHTDNFTFVLATRKTGKVKETFEGFAFQLPATFRKVLEWEPA